MNNPTSNEASKPEAEDSFPIFKTAAYLTGIFTIMGLLVFFFKGGWLLLLMLFMGDFCC